MKEKIVIVGTSGFAREVLALLDIDQYEPVGFLDQKEKETTSLPLPVLGDDSLIPQLQTQNIASTLFVTIGNMEKRHTLTKLALKNSLIDKSTKPFSSLGMPNRCVKILMEAMY